jgi:Zn-dependent M28 family amino/carboxypeptidase
MTSTPRSRRLRLGGTALGAAALLALSVVPADAGNKHRPRVDSEEFRSSVTLAGIGEHLRAFQERAVDGTRASGTPGYAASARYVHTRLSQAGYDPQVQEFTFQYFQTLTESLVVEGGTAEDGLDEVELIAMTYSPSTPEGGLTGELAAPTDPLGCDADAYDGASVDGNIALISRGECSFAQKSLAASAAGATAAIVYNNVPEEPLNGTLGDPNQEGYVPTGGISQEDGEALLAAMEDGAVTVTLNIQTVSEERTTYNVIAETEGGRDNKVVMAGAHLDSVPEGPGINDNASGSAALLEIAEQMADEEPRNTVRFAWWGAEEFGLLGAEHYVAQLSEDEVEDIALYLNFDMVGSPNYVRFVYDGDNSAFGTDDGAADGPSGSGAIERLFHRYFASQGLASEETPFNGRSDYGPFIAVGIPAGGLFTGAEGVKTEEQAEIYGGTAGESYDPCYHQACDDLSNLSRKALTEMSGAMAHAIYTYAMSPRDVHAVGRGSDRRADRDRAVRGKGHGKGHEKGRGKGHVKHHHADAVKR